MRRRRDDEYTIVEPSYSYSWTLGGSGGGVRARKDALFSRTELIHIAIAVLVLISALTLVLGGPSYSDLPVTLVLATTAVLLGFLGHEMAHKIVARRYGCWAEFRADFRGLGIALVVSIFGILLAAPGAVYIFGNISRGQNAKISIAGPLVNIAIAGACVPFFVFDATAVSGGFERLPVYLCFFNAILALFNLIPFPPLDGSKIWRWNLPLYLLVVIASGLLLFLALTNIY